jgi:hypothetical protein
VTTYVLSSPMIITSRLMPGVRIGDVTVSVEPVIWDGRGYACAYYIDGPSGELDNGQDLSVPLIGGESVARDLPRKAMASLLVFLSDAPELFSDAAASWAEEYADDITMMTIDLEASE